MSQWLWGQSGVLVPRRWYSLNWKRLKILWFIYLFITWKPWWLVLLFQDELNLRWNPALQFLTLCSTSECHWLTDDSEDFPSKAADCGAETSAWISAYLPLRHQIRNSQIVMTTLEFHRVILLLRNRSQYCDSVHPMRRNETICASRICQSYGWYVHVSLRLEDACDECQQA